MPITPAQSAAAENQQLQAAQDTAQYLRLIAGPGTGISKQLALLSNIVACFTFR